MSEDVKKFLKGRKSFNFHLKNDTYHPLLYSLNPHGIVIDKDTVPILPKAYDMDIDFSKQKKFTLTHFNVNDDIEKFLKENNSIKFSKIRIGFQDGAFAFENFIMPFLFTKQQGSRFENFYLETSEYLSAYQFATNIIDIELDKQEAIKIYPLLPDSKVHLLSEQIFGNNVCMSIIVLPKTSIHVTLSMNLN